MGMLFTSDLPFLCILGVLEILGGWLTCDSKRGFRVYRVFAMLAAHQHSKKGMMQKGFRASKP